MIIERKEYFLGFENLLDLATIIMVIICQFYFYTTGKLENGYFIPDDDSYFEQFLLLTTLALHLNLILQYMIALDFTRKHVIMII